MLYRHACSYAEEVRCSIKLVLISVVDEALVQLAVHDFFIPSCRENLSHLTYRNGIK